MSNLLAIPTQYSEQHLNFDRVFPLIDNKLQSLISKINNQQISNEDHNFLDRSMNVMNIREVITRELFNEFKTKFQQDIENNSVNKITGLSFSRRADICLGCTQYIDALYMRYGPNGIQVLEREYTYHARLNPTLEYRTIDNLIPYKPLIISQPFFYGKTHIQMSEILDWCLTLNIPVHVDGAWITATKNIELDFSHMAIHSFAVSMSKGYGLSGWNRIGVRWTKEYAEDSVTIMNDFVQIPAENVSVGLYFLKNVQPNYLWATHEEHYNKICQDFNLDRTDSIHLAMRGNRPVGVEALIRYLENV